MPAIETRYGMIKCLSNIEYYPSGAVHSCIAAGENTLSTEVGTLIPQFDANTLRKRQLPTISFHENGTLKVLPLEEQVQIPTPLGMMPAEQVTFYNTGEIKRVFPLNGCLSGYWSQEDERTLASPIEISTPLGQIKTLLMTVYFGQKGNLRSLTFWPGSKLEIKTPCGKIPVRIGVSFHNSGALKSVEPAAPTPVNTPIGELFAFDPDAHGITGDLNSLQFHEDGSIAGLTTLSHVFTFESGNGQTIRIEPPIRTNAVDGETLEPTPICVRFDNDRATFSAPGLEQVSTPATAVSSSRYIQPFISLM